MGTIINTMIITLRTTIITKNIMLITKVIKDTAMYNRLLNINIKSSIMKSIKKSSVLINFSIKIGPNKILINIILKVTSKLTQILNWKCKNLLDRMQQNRMSNKYWLKNKKLNKQMSLKWKNGQKTSMIMTKKMMRNHRVKLKILLINNVKMILIFNRNLWSRNLMMVKVYLIF